MARPILVFASAELANMLVAGIPAAARALRALSQGQSEWRAREWVIAVPGGWEMTNWCAEEMARLAPGITAVTADCADIGGAAGAEFIDGEALAAGEWQAAVAQDGNAPEIGDLPMHADSLLFDDGPVFDDADRAARKRLLRTAGENIITATGKASDGLVSQYLNRPVSRFISRQALRLPYVTPMHGTIAAGLCAIVMAAWLFFGGAEGLIVGALLFQAASVIDGVDGEIARATHRTSKRGAMLDTLSDAATNLAFIAGVAFNLGQQGQHMAALAGLGGLAMLAIGLTMLGMRSRAQGGPFTFDAVKNQFREDKTGFKVLLAKLTSRDVYAFAFTVLIVLGLGAEALIAFAVVIAGWLVVVSSVLIKTRG